MKNNMNKLNECKPNDQFSIKYIDGTPEQKRHLQNLGFVPTTIINVVNVIDDNMIVQVFDSRIAINNEISDHIYGTILKKENQKKRILSFKKR